jgi:Nucleoside 2-deoxyribosyltransferase like
VLTAFGKEATPMFEIYAHEHPTVEQSVLPSIFLAGPSPRRAEDYNWRPEALTCLQELDFDGIVYIPLPRDGKWLDNYDAQIDWELKYLGEAWVVAFWIPRDLVHLPGFTTNVEFGDLLDSGKIVLGYPLGALKMRYLHRRAEINQISISHTLKEALQAAIHLL